MVIEEIITLVNNVVNVINDKLKENDLDGEFDFGNLNRARTSIARKSRTAILQFPVLTSRNLSDQEVLLSIAKALEREYGVFIRTASGLDDIIEVDPKKTDDPRGTGKAKYISDKLHQNLSYADYPVGSMVKDAALSTIEKNGNSYDVDSSNFKPYLKNAAIKGIFESANIELLKIEKSDLNFKSLNEATPKINININKKQKNDDDDNDKITRKIITTYEKNRYGQQLADNDVKKSNELVPTLINLPITINILGEKTAYQENLLIGVKAVIHPVDSDDMIYNITQSLKEKRKFFRFIQWTTGEIAFFKDYLFCLDRIKKEAFQHNKKDKIWRALKVRANKDRLRRMTGKKGDFLPNATILITMEEVEYILNEYGIDLINNINAVRQLFDIYFLLGLVIYDSSNNLVYFIFDGQASYQALPLTALERETAIKVNDVKAITSLMNK